MKNCNPLTKLITTLLLTLLTLSAYSAGSSWREILGPPEGKVPQPQNWTVTWRTNLTKAIAEAREQNRPLFVTFRCLPCKQCSDFDKAVLEGGPDLDPFLTQFITVRLTDASDIDLRIFPIEGFQDLDLSWWGWFLSPEGRVYGIFGGRDHVSDATRISKPALIETLQRVLAHHYDPRRPKWNIDGPIPNLAASPKSPKQLPGYEGWLRNSHEENRHQACLHCHQVNDILRQPAVAAKTFDKHHDFDVWPLPENLGLTLDRDHGLLVTSVEPTSAADKAGIKTGDVLAAAGGRRLFSQADFRGVLHRSPRAAGEIETWWTRGPAIMSSKLVLKEGWRKTNLDWRMSVSQGIVGGDPGFFPLALNKQRREKFNLAEDKMAIEPFMGPNPKSAAYEAGVRQNQAVIAVNGEKPNLGGRAFLVWFIQRFDPGDRVTLTVTDGPNQTRDITYQLPQRGK